MTQAILAVYGRLIGSFKRERRQGGNRHAAAPRLRQPACLPCTGQRWLKGTRCSPRRALFDLAKRFKPAAGMKTSGHTGKDGEGQPQKIGENERNSG